LNKVKTMNVVKELVDNFIYELQHIVIYDKRYKNNRHEISYFRKEELERFIKLGC